jgi:hypothetical protein
MFATIVNCHSRETSVAGGSMGLGSSPPQKKPSRLSVFELATKDGNSVGFVLVCKIGIKIFVFKPQNGHGTTLFSLVNSFSSNSMCPSQCWDWQVT